MDVRSRLAAYRAAKAKSDDAHDPPQQNPGDHVDGRGDEAPTQESAPKVSPPVVASAKTPPTHYQSPWYMTPLKVLLWLLLWALFIEVEFGVVFLITSGLFFVVYSLRGSRRKPWEPSAYSVFNKDCEAIDGTLTGDQFDRELRMGPASVK